MTLELPSTEAVKSIIQEHCPVLGLAQVEDIELALIGQGEANCNVLVTVNQSHRFNLRIGLRNEASVRTLQSEYDVLQVVPERIGPRAFLVDFSRTYLPQPYMLLEFLEGTLKEGWEAADLQSYARVLSRLHQRKFDHHGSIAQPATTRFDFQRRFEVAIDYWRTHHPHLLDLPIVRHLRPQVRHFIDAHNHLFINLAHFTFVHGDAHPLNILFADDQIYLIDWEWAAIGDPAQDIAMLGWDIDTAWQMKLTGAQLDHFLETYLALQPDDTLSQRRDVWMVYTMFFDQIYHRTQIPTDPTGKQAYTVQQIETYLTDRFL